MVFLKRFAKGCSERPIFKERMTGQRKIIHVDMDCFFAQVELRDRPELQGRPVAVGGRPDERGVISAADYVARKYGIRSAMSSAKALKLCPQLTIIHHGFQKYKKESEKIRAVFARHAELIEPLSLDEAFLDVSESQECHGSATLLAQKIRKEIFQETGLTASAGIAPNKFLAKIASDWRKPNGQFTVRPEDIEAFMADLPVQKIFGVGKVTAEKMHKLGLNTCGDLKKLDQRELSRIFGSWGVRLYELCRGQDQRSVKTHRERKSFSVEHTFNDDVSDFVELQDRLEKVYKDFSTRWQKSPSHHSFVRGHLVKVKYFDFKQTTHECQSTKTPGLHNFQELFERIYNKAPEKAIRLIGVGVKLKTPTEKIREGSQISLF